MHEKILIIEDEEKIIKILKLYLAKEGFHVDYSMDGNEGLEKALINDYDFLILDLMLPGVNGEKIAYEIKQVKEIPILMLTAKDKEQDKIQGFLSGADDYVVKPFSPREVILRIKAILKRYGKNDEKIIEYKGIVLNPAKFEVKVDNKNINLTKAEFKILQLFLSYPGRVFERKSILLELTNDEYYISDRTIDAHIKNLRKKLGKNYIKTVFGIGYKIE